MYPITNEVKALFEAEQRKVLRITGKPLKKEDVSVGPSDIVTVNDAAAIPAKDITIAIEPVQSGSGDPSPTNVRPISGWTGANVANISDSEKQSYFAGLLNGTYGFVDLGTLSWSYQSTLHLFYAQIVGTKTVYNYAGLCNKYSKGDTVPNDKQWSNGNYLGGGLNLYIADSTYTDVATFKAAMSGVQLVYELATSATPTITPAQYNQLLASFNLGGWLIPISWQSVAGTVYGGTLDVVNGVLTVTMAEVDLGTLSWSYQSTLHLFYAQIVGTKTVYNYAGLCNKYSKGDTVPNDKQWSNGNYLGGGLNLYIADSTYTDVATFKAAMSGVQLVYELATPQTYQLSPTDVALLLGVNNVWADTGETTLTYRPYADLAITDDNVIEDSFQIDRYSCNGEKLEVGTAIAAQMSFTLENGNGQYDDIVFEGAELFVEIGVADWTQSSPTITYVPCGYFTPDMQPRRLSTISITALDRMTLFDVVVDAADLTFPTTVAGLVGQVCVLCGVTLAQSISGLVNASVAVTELPTVQGEITYRNLIQWCAGIMGTNAWFDWNGQLRFSWYENATGYVSTVDNRYSSDLYEDDLTVSGVEYTNNSGIVIVEGTDDYAIDLTGNAIAGPLVATVLPPLNTVLNGFTYRPFTAATVNAPYMWPMDVVTFTDKDGNNHTSVLTNVTFGLNGTTAMESKGMTYAINKLAQPKGFTREQAQLVNQAMEYVEQDIDASLTQQEIFNRLTDNGAAQGLVLYNGQLYINASYIQSGTLTLGGMNNQNGLLRVLDASGNEIGHWNNNGIAINSGSINLSKTAGNVEGSVKIQQELTNQIEIRYSNETIARSMVLGGLNPINIIDSNSNDQAIISERAIHLLETGGTILSVNKSGGEKRFIYNGDYFSVDAEVQFYQSITISGDLNVNGTINDKRILQATSALPIPSAGGTAIGFITGLTGAHQLVRWNFSSSPENAPPADLTWTTYNGFFIITNNGGTTSESITPVFILPQ